MQYSLQFWTTFDLHVFGMPHEKWLALGTTTMKNEKFARVLDVISKVMYF